MNIFLDTGSIWLLVQAGAVIFFAAAISIIASFTLFNAARLRNIRLSWNAGKFGGFPLFATLFLACSLLVMGAAFLESNRNDIFMSVLYFWLGTGWFLTSYLTSRRYITDHGIVKNVNEPSQTVPWHQVQDFLVREEKDAIHYVFMYNEKEGGSLPKLERIELEIPERKLEEFRKLVNHKLGRRINCSASIPLDMETTQWDID
jgi:hypothetical protein